MGGVIGSWETECGIYGLLHHWNKTKINFCLSLFHWEQIMFQAVFEVWGFKHEDRVPVANVGFVKTVCRVSFAVGCTIFCNSDPELLNIKFYSKRIPKICLWFTDTILQGWMRWTFWKEEFAGGGIAVFHWQEWCLAPWKGAAWIVFLDGRWKNPPISRLVKRRLIMFLSGNEGVARYGKWQNKSQPTAQSV